MKANYAVSAASGLKFTYHIENEDNGSVTVWVNELALSVNAETKDQCMADILDSRRPRPVYDFPNDTSDEEMPAKYWEHKRDKELMISDDDLEE